MCERERLQPRLELPDRVVLRGQLLTTGFLRPGGFLELGIKRFQSRAQRNRKALETEVFGSFLGGTREAHGRPDATSDPCGSVVEAKR